MLCAHQAGIKVFVTGGIGGVHRAGEDSEHHTTHYTLYYHSTQQWILVLTCRNLVGPQ